MSNELKLDSNRFRGLVAERSSTEISRLRAAAYPVLSSVYLVLIFGLPLMLCVLLWHEAPLKWRYLALLGCPFLFAVVFTLVASLLSIPHQKGIIAGKFPRDVGHRVYFHRRLYGLCWTCLFYFKPIYFLILAIDPLRKGTFRLFGYRGSLDFIIYPDTWIRDLPLLTFGDKAYIANRSTLGSNICLQTGQILVGPISIGDRSIVGHLGVIGLGSSIDEDSELGVGVATGIQVSIGRNTKVGAISGLNHGSSVGNDCDIGAMSYVGSGTRVLDGVRLPGGSISPDYSVIDRRTPDREDGEICGPVPGLGEPTPLSVRPDTATSAYVEHHYRACVYDKEICVLFPSAQLGSEVSQGLHAVVVPDLDLARTRNVVNVSEKIRFDFATLSGKLPDTLKISTYDFWSGCLPRTSVGDMDRDAIKNSIRSSSGQIASSPTFQRELSDEDKAWIDRPEVRRVLDVLRAETKSPKSTYHPDDTLEFDLGFNSLGKGRASLCAGEPGS
jgi:acetyltransferase-like isoleucine patch superfamily enzyme